MDSISTTEAPSGSGRWKDAAFAASLANLLFTRIWLDLFSDRDFGYGDRIPVDWPVTLAFLLNLAWLAAVIYFITRQVRRRPHRLIRSLAGSSIPFAPTRTAREAAHDPRPSIEERYSSKEAYLKRVEQVADALVKSGFLVVDDEPRILQRAEDTWDLTVPNR